MIKHFKPLTLLCCGVERVPRAESSAAPLPPALSGASPRHTEQQITPSWPLQQPTTICSPGTSRYTSHIHNASYGSSSPWKYSFFSSDITHTQQSQPYDLRTLSALRQNDRLRHMSSQIPLRGNTMQDGGVGAML